MHTKAKEVKKSDYNYLKGYLKNTWDLNSFDIDTMSIIVKLHTTDHRLEVYDIWEIKEAKERKELIENNQGRVIYNFDSGIGLKTTAQLLWMYKSDKEMTAIVWIAALLWTNIRDERWRGKAHCLIEDLYYEIALNDLPFKWHHATRDAIPVYHHLFDVNDVFGEEFYPDSVEKIVKWAMMEWEIFCENYVLIKLGN